MAVSRVYIQPTAVVLPAICSDENGEDQHDLHPERVVAAQDQHQSAEGLVRQHLRRGRPGSASDAPKACRGRISRLHRAAQTKRPAPSRQTYSKSKLSSQLPSRAPTTAPALSSIISREM